MAVYTSNAYLINQGQIVKPGETLDLSEEQAKNLGELVEKKATNKRTNKEE